jgi:hypothetical protein
MKNSIIVINKLHEHFILLLILFPIRTQHDILQFVLIFNRVFIIEIESQRKAFNNFSDFVNNFYLHLFMEVYAVLHEFNETLVDDFISVIES